LISDIKFVHLSIKKKKNLTSINQTEYLKIFFFFFFFLGKVKLSLNIQKKVQITINWCIQNNTIKVCTQTEQSSNQYNNKQENHSKQKLQPEEERLLEDTPSNHHTTLMVGRLLASTKKSERKQNLLNQTRLRERKQKPGGRHESLPGKKDQR